MVSSWPFRARPARDVAGDPRHLGRRKGTKFPPPRMAAESLEPRLLLSPIVTSLTPRNGAALVGGASNLTIVFDVAMNAATVNASTVTLRDPAGNVLPAAVTYNATTRTATLDPVETLPVTTSYYSARVLGGASGVKDAAGAGMSADVNWSFTTGGIPVFQDRVAFSNLNQPTVVRFARDGRVFVAEKSGLIKVFDSLSDTTASVFADLRTVVHNFWDRGLLGMALHPNFPATPHIYVLYAYDGDIGGSAPKYGTPGTTSDPGPDPTGAGALISGRLSRLVASGNVMSGPEQVLVHDWAQQFPSHSVGSLQFGADGMLYASAGDGASFNYVDYGQTGNPFNEPNREGGALRSQDVRSRNDPTSLDGSIIRIDPATGAAVNTNPLFGTGNDANARRIAAFGLRNPFRFVVRPGTNELWIGDVGWNEWEEINRLRVPADTSADNFGWPAYEGPERQGGYDGANLPLLESLYNAGASAVVTPHYAYNHSAQIAPGDNTGGSSISGLAFYPGGTYPAAFDDALFFSDYSRDRIYVMFRGPGPAADPDAANRAMLLPAAANPVHLEIGPGGDLFYVDFTGSIHRVTYTAAANQPPTAVARAAPTNGPTPLAVSFDGRGSSDPEGRGLRYAWDLDGDGEFDDGTGATSSLTYNTPGNVTVRLRVTDSEGLVDTDSVVISVNNTAPVAEIVAPSAALAWKVGDVITFSGGAVDPDEGALPASALTWSLILQHGNAGGPGYHEHPVQSFEGVASGSFVAPDHEYPSRLELRLTARDSGGLMHTVSRVIEPQTVGLMLQSNPAGLRLALNGTSAATPFGATVIVGSNNTVSAPTPQNAGGTDYTFTSWSEGGAQTHNVIAPPSAATYTATFTPSALPAPWATGDVGAVGAPGSASAEGGVFTLRGSGADIWDAADEFRFAYRTLSGDGAITARVTSVGDTDPWAKAGVMFRDGLGASAAHAMTVLTPGNGAAFQYRAAAGGASTHVAGGAAAAPLWVRVVRTGSTFTGFQSPDGVNWTTVGSATIPMGAQVQVGMAVTAHDDGAVNVATFDNVSVVAAGVRFSPVRINFQPAGSATPAGYLADVGGVFGARSGRVYGWNAPNTATTRDRNSTLSPDQRYDTLIHMQRPENPNAVWEISVPRGNYAVKVVSGDPDHFDSVFRVRAEGVMAVSGTPTDGARWVEGNVTVAVNDGRLTVSNGAGAVNNKLCFVEITQVARASATSASVFAAPAPATAAAVRRRSLADMVLTGP